MTDEEKQAIEYIRNCLDDKYEFKNATRYKDIKYHNIVLNLIDKQQKEIEDYQILKDDIEGHRIVYVDTPEFEEKYISKDKIRKEIEEIKNCRLSTCDEQINMSLNERYEIEDEICEYFEELLPSGQESDQEGG